MSAALISGMMALAPMSPVGEHEHVILLHGLCRTPKSMARLEEVLRAAGYEVHNIAYPSRKMPISVLSERYVGEAVAECLQEEARSIHFVAHSLGAILIRDYLSRHTVDHLGRVVMLGPPN